MSRNRALFIGFCFVLIAVALAIWAYPRLPAVVPVHWDLAGHPNGYSSKFWGVALQPLLMIFLLVLMIVLPAISPKGFRLDQSLAATNSVILAIVIFMFALDVVTLRDEMHARGSGGSIVVPAVGVLLIVIGNYLGKFRKNFFVGIRTPWTLASDEVWLRTHRLGGRLFILGGIALVASGLLTQSIVPILVVIAVIVLVPTIYSYLIYRHIEGFGENAS